MDMREGQSLVLDLRLLADRTLEAIEAGDQELFVKYGKEASAKGEELATLIELDAPQADPEPEPPSSERLQLARDMLEQYHLCRTNLSIREAILRRILAKHGERTWIPAVNDAQNLMMQARSELASVEMTITELMGVDS